MPEQIAFYFVGQSKNFFIKCGTLGLNNENEKFIRVISVRVSSQKAKFLFYFVETRNLYYENFNTNEYLYNTFIFGQFQGICNCISSRNRCRSHDRFDALTNKNVKCLFIRQNDFLLSKDLPTVSIRHSKIFEDRVTLEKIVSL